jgi:DUF2971 family protein
MTPEQMELGIRIGEIFLPYARSQVQRLYPNRAADHAFFVHYTSADAAYNIIKSKQVWMRNTSLMNDYREVWHGFDCLTKAWKKHGPELKTALNEISKDVGSEAETLFNSWSGNIRNRTYITSLSEQDSSENLHGRLSMWRAFGSMSVPRVAIVLRIPWFTGAVEALKVMFTPVAYLNDVQVEKQLSSVVSNVQANATFLQSVDRQWIVNAVFNMLAFAVTSIKHEGFKEEREWRLLYWPDRLPSKDMLESAEIINGIPQRVYRIPLGSDKAEIAGIHFAAIFERLIVGPTQFPTAIHDAFVEELKAAGVADAANRVVASNIPIRS